jgi:hypothetical protein
MKFSIKLAASAVAALIALGGASAHATTNLIVNGDFSNPNVGSGWGDFTGVGWSSNDPSTPGAIEIGNSPIYGLPCASVTVCQNAEVNANAFDVLFQTVTGLTEGKSYNLSYLYGGRTSGGPDTMDVTFGSASVATNTGSIGVWTPNSYIVTATDSSMTLAFASRTTDGLPSYGNEITDVSLTAVPEPTTWAMMLLGLGGIGATMRMARRKTVAGVACA